MPDHEIAWDHTDCDHDEPWCWPTGTITCTAPIGKCRMDGECQVVLFMEDAGDLINGNYKGASVYPPGWIDGPVDVHWTGEGYLWSYPVAVLNTAANALHDHDTRATDPACEYTPEGK